MIELMKLSFAEDALEPVMTKREVELHYHKHHKSYVDNLNKLLPDTPFQNMSLEKIVKESKTGPIFNNAAQIWNHNFFWNSLTAESTFDETSKFGKQLIEDFGSLDKFKKEANEKIKKFFASGWCWVGWKNGKIQVTTTHNAHNPLSSNEGIPLLTIDLWEHAWTYDPQYAADRKTYVEKIWDIINWKYADEQFTKNT